jgi:hypothetical protein
MLLVLRLDPYTCVFDRNTNLLSFKIIAYLDYYFSLKGERYGILDEVDHDLQESLFVSNHLYRNLAF